MTKKISDQILRVLQNTDMPMCFHDISNKLPSGISQDSVKRTIPSLIYQNKIIKVKNSGCTYNNLPHGYYTAPKKWGRKKGTRFSGGYKAKNNIKPKEEPEINIKAGTNSIVGLVADIDHKIDNLENNLKTTMEKLNGDLDDILGDVSRIRKILNKTRQFEEMLFGAGGEK